MTQNIVRLSEDVINQIAAGEVVENPASIVKELIENSLDAGARKISIRIQTGGQQLIEIEDDGCGMSSEDAILCLERHATSKIRTAEDLYALNTMGFRGEALAAISSISHFELKTSDGNMGTHILAQGGKIASISPMARNRGTTIAIRSLFFNVPARKKFQKSPSANTAQVAKVAETLALAHPEVSFVLKSQSDVLLRTEPEDRKKRIESLLGPFAHEVEMSFLQGFLSSPQNAKTHRRNQFLFINRRPVFSPVISRAVQAGYGTRIAENHYPPFILFLTIDSTQVDVNVHPQKKEVRLSCESALFHKIESAVAEAFAPQSFSEPISFTPHFTLAEETFPRPQPPSFQEMELPFEIEERLLTVAEHYLLIEKEGLIAVDLKAAHARILYERLAEKKGSSQALLWPLEIDLEDEDLPELEKMGIECRSIGVKRIAIDALPEGLEAEHFASFFSAWKEQKTIDTAAVRFCYGLKKNYSSDEALFLWRNLQKCRDRLYDPLGKRIWMKIRSIDFEKMMREAAKSQEKK